MTSDSSYTMLTDNLNDEPPKKKKPRGVDPRTKVEKAAKKAGFGRRSERQNVASDQINLRARVTDLARFREIAETQDPPWSLGYTFARAIQALDKELSKDSDN